MDKDSTETNYMLVLELTQEQWETFEACRKALDHDEPEQTANLMLGMLVRGIALTSKENPMLYLYTRDPHKAAITHVVCPTCKKEVPVVHQVSDGFRECGFRLIP